MAGDCSKSREPRAKQAAGIKRMRPSMGSMSRHGCRPSSPANHDFWLMGCQRVKAGCSASWTGPKPAAKGCSVEPPWSSLRGSLTWIRAPGEATWRPKAKALHEDATCKKARSLNAYPSWARSPEPSADCQENPRHKTTRGSSGTREGWSLQCGLWELPRNRSCVLSCALVPSDPGWRR